MKILQILPELNAGGVERGTLEVGKYLVEHGHQSLVVSNGGRLVEQLEREGSRHIQLPVHKKSLSSLGQVLVLRRLLKEEAPDILHLRSRVPAWIAWLAWRKLPPATRPRLVTTVHGFYSVNAYSAIMTRGERVICVSESTQRYVLENYPKIPNDCIRVIPRGIDPAGYGRNRCQNAEWRATRESAYPEFAGKCLLLLPGRITRLKGHEDFFRLVGALKQGGIPAHGLVAGDAHPKKQSYVQELRCKLAELGLEAEVTFLGHRSDIREVMGAVNLVCALSQQPESFGRTVLEALALGKPVVGYDCGGVGELLERLFPVGRVPLGDHTRLVDAATTILRSRPVPSAVGEPFTLDAMCQSTLSLYQQLNDSRDSV